MAWRYRMLLAAVFTVFMGLVFASQTQAWTQFRSGNAATVPGGQTLDSSLWAGAKNIDIAGTVNGDVFCGGQTVNISGTVNGDVICAAQTITISGSVSGSVRLAAQTINITGSIGQSATLAGQTINTDSKSVIGMDASFAASDVNLNGKITRDLAVGGSSVNVNGEVGRDITSSAGKITVNSGAKIGGGIEYTSKNTITINNGASVAGQVTQHLPKDHNKGFGSFFVFTGKIAFIAALLLLITAVIVTALFPQMVHTVSGQAIRRPWWVLLTGFVASIIIPIAIILLLITIIGIPLAILLTLCWWIIVASSGLFSAYYLGRRVWRGQENPLFRVLLGGLILLVLFMIPFLGFLVILLTFWMGVGMALLELKDRIPKPKYNLK